MADHVKQGGASSTLKRLAAEVLRHLGVPILVIDRRYTVVAVNPSLCAHLDLPADKIVGQACYRVTHRSEEPCWAVSNTFCPVKAAFETRSRVRAIHTHQIEAGMRVEEIVATPLPQEDLVLEEFRNIDQLLGLVDGVLPICAACKRVCDADGRWLRMEGYIRRRTGADFSHGVCPECLQELYPDLLVEREPGDDEPPR